MEIREALILQNPSLALQRAAAIEIAKLDAKVAQLTAALDAARNNTLPIYDTLQPI